MRFEDVPAGEPRQINGPLWGVRVLSAGVGAALLVDRSPVPVASLLLTLRAPEARPFDRLNMTGPIVLQIAETPDDDLSAAGVAPPVAPPVEWSQDLWLFITTGAAFSRDFLNPGWARQLSLWGWNLGGVNPSLVACIIAPDGSVAQPAGDHTIGAMQGPYVRCYAALGPGAAGGTAGLVQTSLLLLPHVAPFGVRIIVSGAAGISGRLWATWGR